MTLTSRNDKNAVFISSDEPSGWEGESTNNTPEEPLVQASVYVKMMETMANTACLLIFLWHAHAMFARNMTTKTARNCCHQSDKNFALIIILGEEIRAFPRYCPFFPVYSCLLSSEWVFFFRKYLGQNAFYRADRHQFTDSVCTLHAYVPYSAAILAILYKVFHCYYIEICST